MQNLEERIRTTIIKAVLPKMAGLIAFSPNFLTITSKKDVAILDVYAKKEGRNACRITVLRVKRVDISVSDVVDRGVEGRRDVFTNITDGLLLRRSGSQAMQGTKEIRVAKGRTVFGQGALATEEGRKVGTRAFKRNEDGFGIVMTN